MKYYKNSLSTLETFESRTLELNSDHAEFFAVNRAIADQLTKSHSPAKNSIANDHSFVGFSTQIKTSVFIPVLHLVIFSAALALIYYLNAQAWQKLCFGFAVFVIVLHEYLKNKHYKEMGENVTQVSVTQHQFKLSFSSGEQRSATLLSLSSLLGLGFILTLKVYDKKKNVQVIIWQSTCDPDFMRYCRQLTQIGPPRD